MTIDIQKPKSAPDGLLAAIASSIEEWKQEHTEHEIRKQVFKMLDASKNRILCKLMGFEQDSWSGGWKIDHCNGRAGNSPIGDHFKSINDKAIRAWIENIGMPELNDEERQKIKADIKSEYLRLLSRNLSQLVRERANKDLTALIEEVTKETQLGAYMQMRKLLDPENKDINTSCK